MSDMLSWLRSTIEGDKATAEANGGEVWSVAGGRDDEYFIGIEGGGSLGQACGCCVTGTLDEVEAKHVALHDPRDTIARCEAELALLDAADRAAPDFWWGMREAIGILARGYRHRPGFKPEWVES